MNTKQGVYDTNTVVIIDLLITGGAGPIFEQWGPYIAS